MSIGRISNHSADTKSDAPRCIDDQLGRASDRFFGEGFTLVRHELTRTAHSNNRIDFTISATYPDDWSRKNGRSQKPHLSSVDAMVLTAQMIEEYLNHNESTHGTTTLWISHCSLRPGQQPVDVSRPLQASMEIEGSSDFRWGWVMCGAAW
ncbi:AvrD family protein [Microbacterium lacticum]